MMNADDIDDVAAEYVLGTLSHDERAEVGALRAKLPALQNAIAAWENRLASLNDTTPPVAPSADLLTRIEQRLALRGSNNARVDRPVSARAVQTWRFCALAASVALMIMTGVAVYQAEYQPAFVPKIALLQSKDSAPVFVVSLDTKGAKLVVRAVAATAPAGKDYELWLIADNATAPRALGILPHDDIKSVKLSDQDAAVISGSTLAVSVEPTGGSPTGQPTGPVILTGKFL